MSSRRDSLSDRKRPCSLKQNDQGKQPQKTISRLNESSKDKISEQASPDSPPSIFLQGTVPPRVLHDPSKLHQKRKREAEYSSPQDQEGPPSEQHRSLPPSRQTEEEPQNKAEGDTSKNLADPVQTWIYTNGWPIEYFQQDDQVRKDFEHDSWLEEIMELSTPPIVQYMEINGMRYPRPVKKIPTLLRRKWSDSNLTGSSDQNQRENRSSVYRNTRYAMLLEAKGGYMSEFDIDDIPQNVKDLCQRLRETGQAVPKDSLFRDDLFAKVCQSLQDRNEAMIIQNVTRLIVPSAQNLAVRGATHLKCLVESVNEGWIGCIPVEGPRPQPDYSVGFGRSAFTEEQLRRLDPLIGTVYDTSFFAATYRMYFPFLTCEVNSGTAGLDTADRQNAHSMMIAVRGVVELYRAVKREKELHREILAFSISHDQSSVRIYGHYAVITEDKTTFYRHPINGFNFTMLDGKDKWTAHKFTKNVYDVWMPTHLKRICSVIDQLSPDLNFKVS